MRTTWHENLSKSPNLPTDTAQTVHSAVEARVENGLATQPEFLHAKQQLAQVQFDLEKAHGAERDAFTDLMNSIGLSPSVRIRIAENFAGSVEIDLETPLVSLVTRALSHRPDLVISLANVIGIAPRVSGPITRINVTDNQFVKGGDLLFEIDPADFELNVDRAKSALDALDQQIETAKAQDAQLKYQVKAAEAAVRQATAERDQAADTLRRLEPLLPKGFATKEQVDEARTKVATLDAQVAQANEKLNQASVAVSSLATLQAQRPGAVATLGTAQLELSYTRIYAPFDGQVVGLNISEGAYVHAGAEVFAFLDSRKWYVLANFRERELQNIIPGMRAEIYLLSNPDRRFQGIVQGISPAVQSQENNVEVKGLPFVKRDLNWVRIAQRFPVRIEIENPDPKIFRMGTTAVTTIVGFTASQDATQQKDKP